MFAEGDAIAIGAWHSELPVLYGQVRHCARAQDGDYDANPFLLGAEASNPAEVCSLGAQDLGVRSGVTQVPIFASEGGAEAQQAAAVPRSKDQAKDA